MKQQALVKVHVGGLSDGLIGDVIGDRWNSKRQPATVDTYYIPTLLTHWGLVTPYGVGDLGQHWFR